MVTKDSREGQKPSSRICGSRKASSKLSERGDSTSSIFALTAMGSVGGSISKAIPCFLGYPLVYDIVEDKGCYEVYAIFILCHINMLPFACQASVSESSQDSQNVKMGVDEIRIVREIGSQSDQPVV